MNEINWTGHLDVMLFIIIFYPVAVEYLKWRLGI
jgi:biopolymer transport protein ExbD|tara:strand:+ start:9757 stop:9858 length:102 start_codon:yes stop_codon:yes gene_type:complete